MSDWGRTARRAIGVLLAGAACLIPACGGGGTDVAGGGTGGTGISTGAITGFGSVVVNATHFLTDGEVSTGFVTRKMFNMADMSSQMDRDLFRVGMVVIVHHGSNDNNAQEIEYRDNLEGPVAAKNSGTDNTLTVLGQTVVVDNAALFAALNPNDVVKVSGLVDATGRIHASYIDAVPCSTMMMCPVTQFEVKGFVSGLSASEFRLDVLPGGAGSGVMVSYPPAIGTGLANGLYVQVVTTDSQPASGTITATGIQVLSPRTAFPENAAADLEGLVTSSPTGPGNDLFFDVEGKRVHVDGNTQFVGGAAADIHPDVKLQVRGTETGGVLSAAGIIFR